MVATVIPSKADVTAHVKTSLKTMLQFISEEFDISLLVLNSGTYKMDFKKLARTAVGGTKNFRPFMKLSFGQLVESKLIGYTEYKSFNNNTVIGGFYTDDWRIFVDTILCHELAHVVQFILPQVDSRLQVAKTPVRYYYVDSRRVEWERGHGDFFKAIYAVMRTRFINFRVQNIGRKFPEKWFLDSVPTTAKFAVNNHELLGKHFAYSHKLYKVIEFNPRRWRYPVIAVDNSGKRYKFPENTVKSCLIVK